jgi:ATP/maltotriose-dependent transcriptional regulator MalT
MGTVLLKSKLRFPIRPAEMVARPALRAALQEAVEKHKLVLIQAPAGYGKTILLADWAHVTHLPVAWLSVTGEEASIDRFLRYLLAAWEIVQPEVVEAPVGLLLGSQAPDIQEALISFLNAAEQAPGQLAFVLDDYHLVEDSAIHSAMTFLLDHLPPNVHFVMASRGEPPLPLARYRARRQLFELRANDLRFTRAESAAFLSQVARLTLSPEEISTLHTNTEGWVAGLQLAALTIQRTGKALDQPAVHGGQRYIVDYLSEDVLARLPEVLQDFLVKTSILDQLCASLCEQVTGITGSQAMLESLEQQNLFIIPLDDRRAWYRYHALFGAFLQTRLNQRPAEESSRLHGRAARWYLAHDLPEPAFQHALAGRHIDVLIQIFDRYINALLMGGEMRVVERWIADIPAEWEAAYPVLGLARAGYLAFSGAFDACFRCIDEVEENLAEVENEDTHWQMARVTAVRCMMACTVNELSLALAYASQALEALPEDDLSFRPSIYAALGDTYRKSGDWQAAKECYLKVLDFSQSPVVKVQAVHAYGALADLALRQGRLREADGYWNHALAIIRDQSSWGNFSLPVIGWVYTRMGELLYERNELKQAWDYLARGLEYAEMGGDVRALIASYLDACRFKLAEGNLQAAEAYLERARPLVEQAPFPEWTSRFERSQLELWLAQDELREAVQWAETLGRNQERLVGPESETSQLALGRVLIEKGDPEALLQAKKILEPLSEAAQKEGRMGVVIEALALLALAEWKRAARPAALTALEQALRLAEPEGYIRLFADLGLPIGRLLQEAFSRGVMPGAIEKILLAFRTEFSLQAKSPLPGPLTDREREILERIAAGLTNREIAEELVIAPETVKKHAGNIYNKLGVSSRTQAVAKAKALNWML